MKILTFALVVHMNELRINELRKLEEGAMAPVNDVYAKFKTDNAFMCWGYAKVTGNYQMELYRSKSTAVSFQQTDLRLGSAWHALVTVTTNLPTLITLDAYKCKYDCTACAGVAKSFLDTIKSVMAKSRANMRGLCFECERRGVMMLGKCEHGVGS